MRHGIQFSATSRASWRDRFGRYVVTVGGIEPRKGSLELLADRDPEEARKLLHPVLELMMEAVHHYEGTVNQAAGDGIMAIFGAPIALEDHAFRGCLAALDLQEQAQAFADELRGRDGIDFRLRVGLNSGEVIAGEMGSGALGLVRSALILRPPAARIAKVPERKDRADEVHGEVCSGGGGGCHGGRRLPMVAKWAKSFPMTSPRNA